MARFPIREQQTRPQAQRADAADFGAIEARAQTGLGQAVGGFADVLVAKEEHDALIKAKQEASEIELELISSMQDLRNSSPVDGAGHSDAVKQLIDERWEKAKEGKSGKALEYLNNISIASRGSHIPREIAFQSKLYGTALSQKEVDIHSKAINAVRLDPSQLSKIIGLGVDRVNGYTYDPSTKQGLSESNITELTKGNTNDYIVAAAEGSIANATSSAQARQVIEELKGAQWKDRVPAKEYESILKQADQKLRQMEAEERVIKSVAKSEMSGQVNDYVAALADGNLVSRPTGITDERIRMVFGDNASEIISDVRRYEDLAPALSVIRSGTKAEASVEVDKVKVASDGTSDDYLDKKKVEDIAQKALNVRNKMLRDEPAEYALKNSPMLQGKLTSLLEQKDPDVAARESVLFIEASIQEQLRLGVSPYHTEALTSSQIESYRDIFNAPSGKEGEGLYNSVQSLRNATGKYFNKAIDELYAEKAIPRGVTVLAGLKNSRDASRLAEALTNFKETVASSNMKSSDYSTFDVMREYLTSLGPFVDTVKDSSEMIAAGDALAVENLRTGVSNPIGSAYDTLVGKKYEFYGNLRIPRSSGLMYPGPVLDKLEHNFETIADDPRNGDIVDWGAIASRTGAPAEDIKNATISAIRGGKLHYFTAPDDSGLVIVNENGATLPGVNGGPYILKWSNLPSVKGGFVMPQPVP